MNQNFIQKNQNIQESDPCLKYHIKSMIGQGQYGKVYKAQLKNSHHHSEAFAIKIISALKIKKNPKVKELLKNQIQILCTLKHKNIIEFKQMYIWEKKIYMVYEYCEGGDLQNRIPLPEKQILPIAKKIIAACIFSSKFSIIHRDLKPANILFKNGKVKVADWGFSRFLKNQNSAESFIGSPAYMAPEILKGNEYSSKADVWSFGMMIYECISGDFPWNGSNIKKLLNSIELKPLKIPQNISPILKKILKQSLIVNPSKRSSFIGLNSLFEVKQVKEKFKQHLNPEQTFEKEKQELTFEQVKKCSFYLQMAKRMVNFDNEEAKNICLDIIVQNLEELRNKNDLSLFNKSELIPRSPKVNMTSNILTQKKLEIGQVSRQLSKAKSYGRIKKELYGKSLSKIIPRQKQKNRTPQTILLLQKQIQIIRKMRISSKGKYNFFENEKNQGKKVKNLINAILNSVEPTKGDSSGRDSKGRQKKKLAEMNCMLDIIMYKQLPDEYKNKQFGDYVTDLEQTNRSMLLKLLNHKILYINKRYCRL